MGSPAGKRYSILGDSISTFEGCVPSGYRVFYEHGTGARGGVERPEQTWWSLVIDHFQGTLLSNGSFSGSTVEGPAFPAGCSPERIASLAHDGAHPDHIVLYFGINDYGWGGFANQAAGRSAACPCLPEQDLGKPRTVTSACPEQPETFERAYRRMLQRIVSAYPQATVWCCTLLPGTTATEPRTRFAYCLRGIHLDRYNDAIRRAAADVGCRVVDVRSFGKCYEAIEGTHPTLAGMRQLAALIVRGMEAAGAPRMPWSGVLKAALESAPAADEPCDRAACFKCEHAVAPGNAWVCLCRRP